MMLKRLGFLVTILGAALTVMLSSAPASSQATRTWVSGVGDDVNPCSRTAPCKTFAGAISKTTVGGEIDCLDPGGFGALTITKSITIDCHEVFGSVLVQGTNGIVINSDTAPNVRLRNLNFAGLGTGLNGVLILGTVAANTVVILQDLWIDDFTTRGISDTRANGGKLYISNTTVHNAAGAGIGVFPSSGSTRTDTVIDGGYFTNNGIAAAFGGSGRVMINRSVFSGSATTGIEVDGGQINVDNSVISNNGGTGIQNDGATVVVSNSDIAFNSTGITGATQSFTNNRVSGNGSAGTAPTPIAPNPSNPSGQQ
jgi:Right handed beta helix region